VAFTDSGDIGAVILTKMVGQAMGGGHQFTLEIKVRDLNQLLVLGITCIPIDVLKCIL